MLPVPSAIDLVDAAAVSYDAAAKPWFVDDDNAVRIFLVRLKSGLACFVPEGTHNLTGWLLDFAALMAPAPQRFDHKGLGPIHSGFYYASLPALTEILKVALTEPVGMIGHSLGAAMAILLGCQLIDFGIKPVVIAGYAPPRVGTKHLVKIATSVPHQYWRYGTDPVTQVPFRLRKEPFEQVPLTHIGPPAGPIWKPSNHHFPNYQSGVRAYANGR